MASLFAESANIHLHGAYTMWSDAWTIFFILVAIAIFVVMIMSKHFRATIYEIWNHIGVPLLKWAWVYVLVAAGYDLLRSGGFGVDKIIALDARYILYGLGLAAIVLMFASSYFRGIVYEIWNVIGFPLIKWGWIYAVITAVYLVLTNGTLENIIHAMRGA